MVSHPRKHLPHDIPLWVDPSKETYYITINCRERGQNQLARADIAEADYILANPVRAGLVTRPEDWPFVYFGDGRRPEFRV